MCINQNHNIPNMATEIVAAHAEGRVRHYNGGQCYIDDNDLSLVIIDHTFGWERSEYPAESEVAKAYRAATPYCRPADLEAAARLAEFFAAIPVAV